MMNPTNCHGSWIQVSGNPGGAIDLWMVQRSVDVIVGLPHNLVQYWAFFLWLSHVTRKRPGRFLWTGGDVHVYEAHFPLAERVVHAAKEYTRLETPELVYATPQEDFAADDFDLAGDYKPLIKEKAVMVV